MICELCGNHVEALKEGCCEQCSALLAPPAGTATSTRDGRTVTLGPLSDGETNSTCADESRERLAVVTGGNRGIGRAITQRLLEAGFNLHVIDIDGANFESLRSLGHGKTRRCEATLADVTDDAAMKRLMAELGRRHGAIHVLVNNAGIYHADRAEQYSRAAWERQFEVNVTAPFQLCQAVLPWMPARSGARIINIASVVGTVGAPFSVGYVASKHALVGMTRALALDLAPRGINVNAIAPGLVDTDMLKQIAEEVAPLAGGVRPEQVLGTLIQEIPQHRLVQPRDVADLALYLATRASDSVTGQVINVSGGWLVS